MRRRSICLIKCIVGLSVAFIAVSNCFNVLSNSSKWTASPADGAKPTAAALPYQHPDSLGAPNTGVTKERDIAIETPAALATRAALISPFAPSITATKSHSPAGSANPGDTLTYTIVITNSGSMDATGVNFSDTIDPNTMLVPGSVKASPIAVDDSYHTIGNVNISVPAAQGVVANDSNSGFGTLIVTKVNATPVPGTTSTANGSVTMSSDGSFTYTPNAAFRGPSDSFTYELSNGPGSTDTATVTIAVNGLIWFVDSSAAPGGDGRLSTPFNCLVGAGCFDPAAADIANDNIFVYSGSYTGGFSLLNGQKLIGQGAGDTLLGITGLTAPSGTNLLPSTGGANPAIAAAGADLTLASGNTVRGVTLNGTASAAVDLSGTGFGTLTLAETTLGGTGQALSLNNGTLSGPVSSTAAFQSISSTNSSTTGISLTNVAGNMSSGSTSITNPSGIGISVDTSSAAVNFGPTSSFLSGGTGVSLTTNTGAITFAALNINPDSGQRGLLATENSMTITSTSGNISTTGATAVEITRSSGTTPLVISQTSVSASGGANGIKLSNTSGSFTVSGDGAMTAGLLDRNGSGGTLNATTGHSVLLSNATNVTLRQMNITNTASSQDGVNSTGGGGITLSAVLLQTLGRHGWNATNITGVNSLDNNSRVQSWQAIQSNGVVVNNTSTNFTSFTIDNSLFTTSATGAAGFLFTAAGTTTGGTVNVTSSEFTLIDQSAVQINNNGSGTITAIVKKNNFHDADATGGDGNNTLYLTNDGSGQLNFTVGGPTAADGNVFKNLARLIVLAGVVQVDAATVSKVGTKLNGSIQHNNISNDAGFSNGRRAIDIQIESNASTHGGHSILIADNTINNVDKQGVSVTMNSVAGGDCQNNNVTIKNNVLTNVGTEGNVDSGSAIEFETSFDAANTGGDLSSNVLIQGNSAQNNNTSGVGSTLEINNRAVGGSNTSSMDLTIWGNSFTNTATTGTAEVFEILNPTGTPSTCLEMNSANNPANANSFTGGAGTGFKLTNNAGTFSIAGMSAGAQTTAAVQTFVSARNNSLTVTAAGSAGFTGSPAGCTISSASVAGGVEISSRAKPAPVDDNPASDDQTTLLVPHSESADHTGATRITQEELTSMVQAALERWREAGLPAEDLSRLQAVTFSLARLGKDQLANAASTQITIDETAAGYGWFVDQTPWEDSEFDVAVIDKERQTTEVSPAYGKIDLLTVVMRELGAVYLQGRNHTPKQVRSLMANTLSHSVRRMPVFNIPVRTVSSRTGGSRSLNEPAAPSQSANYSNSGLLLRPANFNLGPDTRAGWFGNSAKRMSYTTNARRAGSPTPAVFSGETVNLSIGTIPPGKSVTIMFQAVVNNPFPNGVCTVTNQGHVTGTNFSPVDTNIDVTPINKAVTIGSCPASVATNTDAGVCTAVVTFSTPTADGCPAPTVTCSPASGTAFAKGVTTVTCTATNGTPPDATCTFTVTVNDAEAPTITCPGNVTQGTDAGVCTAVVNYTNATATDNCPGVGTPVCTPASGTTFNKGTTTVTCTVSDASSNSANCSFTVTVNDTTAPTITCPASVVQSTDPNVCNAVVSYPNATATDNCPGVGTPVCSPSSGSTFAKGVTTVTCTVSDASSNSANCTFTVTVKDTQAPNLGPCPPNMSVTSSGGCQVVNYTPPTATDNCGSATVNCSPAPGFCFPTGTTTVTCTASDTSPDSPDSSCSFTVTVVPCAITCPSNISVGNDPGQCGATVTYSPNTNGGCGTIVCSPSSGSFFPVGTTTVTCMTTAGPSCSFTVTVNDTEGPQITVTTQTIELWPPNHSYHTITMSDLVASATDNCSGNLINSVVIASVSSDEAENAPGSGDGNTTNDIVIAANCKSVQLRAERDTNFNGRVYTIVLRVTDGAGNVGTASRTVIVPLNQSGGGAILGPGPGYTVLGTCP